MVSLKGLKRSAEPMFEAEARERIVRGPRLSVRASSERQRTEQHVAALCHEASFKWCRR